MYNLRQIPSDAQIKKLVRKILFRSHVHCPRCKSRQVYKSENRYRCRSCRRPFSLTSNTWLNNMKLSWQTFYLLLWCWLNHLPITQTLKMTSLSEVTIREWFEKFRLNLAEKSWLEPLKDTVQMDGAFFGKKLVVVAKDVKSKRIVLRVLPQTNSRNNTLPNLSPGILLQKPTYLLMEAVGTGEFSAPGRSTISTKGIQNGSLL